MITCDKNHIYRNDKGEIYLSVTQHLTISGLQDFSMCRKEDLDFAALRGKYVHKAHYMYLLDDLVVDNLDAAYKGYCEAFIKFYKEQNIEVWDSESVLYSKNLRTAGSFDLMCLFSGFGSVVEFKTSAIMPKTTGLQTAAYKLLWNEREPDDLINTRIGVQLLKTGKYRMRHYVSPKDENIFRNICHTNWWCLSNRIIPLGAKADPKTYELCKEIIG